MKGVSTIVGYTDSLANHPIKSTIQRDALDEELYPIADALENLTEKILGFYDFSVELANGNIDAEVDRENYMSGPLKDLQSTLRHMVWQTKRVAAGDYNQKMEFLGEFSDSFNLMTEQLKSRERLLQENADLRLKTVEQRETILQQQLDQQAAYYRSQAVANMNMARFRHDVKNHMMALENLTRANKKAEALDYLNNIIGIVGASKQHINTGNYMMDALVSQKIESAKAQEIEVNYDIVVDDNLPIEDFDWCVLLGNSLDNAIEACTAMKEGKKFIDITIKSIGEMLSITVRNSFERVPEVNPETGLFKSTKQDKTGHGLGMNNIKLTAEKYDGSIKTEIENDVFSLFILLCGLAQSEDGECKPDAG